MKKQTAVEWLVSQLNKDGFTQVVTDEEIEQAQAMEKQQIIDAYSADRFPCSDEDAEQYYTENYKP